MSGRFALVIGNSHFDDQRLNQLVTPGQDVDGLEAVLRDPEIGKFNQVTKLVDQSADHLRRMIAKFFHHRDREDLLLFYYSGHGLRDENTGRLYLAARDTEFEHLRASAVGDHFINGEMDNSLSRRQIVILDCCHSGAFEAGTKGGGLGASVGTVHTFGGSGLGRALLTASDATQYAWEGDQILGGAENSLFTHFLIEGLKEGGADLDGDGKVTLDELYDYIYRRVIEHTPKQKPNKSISAQQGEFVIAFNPAQVPPELVTALGDKREFIRAAAIEEACKLLEGIQPGMDRAVRRALQPLAKDESQRVSRKAKIALGILKGREQKLAQEQEHGRELATGNSGGGIVPAVDSKAAQEVTAVDKSERASRRARRYTSYALLTLLLAVLGTLILAEYGPEWGGSGAIKSPIVEYPPTPSTHRAVPVALEISTHKGKATSLTAVFLHGWVENWPERARHSVTVTLDKARRHQSLGEFDPAELQQWTYLLVYGDGKWEGRIHLLFDGKTVSVKQVDLQNHGLRFGGKKRPSWRKPLDKLRGVETRRQRR